MSGSFELLILNDKFNEKPYYIGYNTGKGLAHTAPKRKKKSHLGQFIFSTHNVLHLDLKMFMKEQIYFVRTTEYIASQINQYGACYHAGAFLFV